MVAGIPSDYRRKPMYTDGYVVYPNLIAPWQHHVCEKGSGQTNSAEGGNTFLRHRVSYLVSYLVRKSTTFAPGTHAVGDRLAVSPLVLRSVLPKQTNRQQLHMKVNYTQSYSLFLKYCILFICALFP
jgi:hypothetical protein